MGCKCETSTVSRKRDPVFLTSEVVQRSKSHFFWAEKISKIFFFVPNCSQFFFPSVGWFPGQESKVCWDVRYGLQSKAEVARESRAGRVFFNGVSIWSFDWIFLFEPLETRGSIKTTAKEWSAVGSSEKDNNHDQASWAVKALMTYTLRPLPADDMKTQSYQSFLALRHKNGHHALVLSLCKDMARSRNNILWTRGVQSQQNFAILSQIWPRKCPFKGQNPTFTAFTRILKIFPKIGGGALRKGGRHGLRWPIESARACFKPFCCSSGDWTVSRADSTMTSVEGGNLTLAMLAPSNILFSRQEDGHRTVGKTKILLDENYHRKFVVNFEFFIKLEMHFSCLTSRGFRSSGWRSPPHFSQTYQVL